jgi:hypothetical protein
MGPSSQRQHSRLDFGRNVTERQHRHMIPCRIQGFPWSYPGRGARTPPRHCLQEECVVQGRCWCLPRTINIYIFSHETLSRSTRRSTILGFTWSHRREAMWGSGGNFFFFCIDSSMKIISTIANTIQNILVFIA